MTNCLLAENRSDRLGVGPREPFDADALDDELRAAIRAGVAAARETVAAKIPTIAQKINGWTYSDIFGAREWYSGNFQMRAGAAMAGWGGNDVIEAIYPSAREDAEGVPLDGVYRYQLTFTILPPAKAFWSVTM